MSSIENLTNTEAVNLFLLNNASSLHVLYFWASWDEPSKQDGPVDVVMKKLAEMYPTMKLAKVRIW